MNGQQGKVGWQARTSAIIQLASGHLLVCIIISIYIIMVCIIISIYIIMVSIIISSYIM